MVKIKSVEALIAGNYDNLLDSQGEGNMKAYSYSTFDDNFLRQKQVYNHESTRKRSVSWERLNVRQKHLTE